MNKPSQQVFESCNFTDQKITKKHILDLFYTRTILLVNETQFYSKFKNK